jgi:hypothetical protein
MKWCPDIDTRGNIIRFINAELIRDYYKRLFNYSVLGIKLE